MSAKTNFEFKALPYSYDELEPFIDQRTLEIHYSKHHKAYFDNFIGAIKNTDLESMTITEIFNNISHYSMLIRNNSGGYFNHTFYWESMKKPDGELPSDKLLNAINETFDSLDELKKQFLYTGKTRFGSGWAWLNLDNNGELFICSTPNQDNPLMNVNKDRGMPLLAMDVWEHAYYLKYENKRDDYMNAFWNVVNWNEVSKRYENALKLLLI